MPTKGEVIILYNCPDPQGTIPWRESDAGVLNEVNAVVSALDALGVACRRHGVRRLDDVPTILKAAPGAAVFNLVERLEGGAEAWNQIPELCRAFGHPCTGSSSACLKLTQNKWHTKERLRDCGIPVPAACVVPPGAPVMDLAYHFIGRHTTALMSDGPTLARLHAAVDTWGEQWGPGRRAPGLSALDIGDTAIVIADTRRIAKRRMTILSWECDDALRHFEKARREDSVDPAMEPHLELLLDHRFVVRHEGHLVSVVTRPPKRAPDAPMVQAPRTLLTTR